MMPHIEAAQRRADAEASVRWDAMDRQKMWNGKLETLHCGERILPQDNI